MSLEAISAATRYISKFGWGTQGKMLGISKMFNDSDCALLKKGRVATSLRPRGVLSGFLAIVPSLRAAVYLPPVAGKMPTKIIRLRLSEEILSEGAVLSCYWNGSVLVLEDILAWGNEPLWQTMPFSQRWNEYMTRFADHIVADRLWQGHDIALAEYTALSDTVCPADREVLEFIPDAPHSKRLIWVPGPNETGDSNSNVVQHVQATQKLTAKREATVGPDIYSLWGPGREKIGMALVRTLAVSRLLRQCSADEFPVQTIWNKYFERHEIIGCS
jgi:hypothetical protein